jgi:Flp pilus assembly protein TadB
MDAQSNTAKIIEEKYQINFIKRSHGASSGAVKHVSTWLLGVLSKCPVVIFALVHLVSVDVIMIIVVVVVIVVMLLVVVIFGVSLPRLLLQHRLIAKTNLF